MTRGCSIVLGMAANFREVAACSGVDENCQQARRGSSSLAAARLS
jgi:hypothetical protein